MTKLKIDAFIDPILNYINTNPDHQKYFDFTFKAQKYEPKLLLKMIGIVLKEGLSWRSIATFYGDYEIFPKWQTVYAFYKKLINKRIILSTYAQMLKKYYIKNKNDLQTQVLFIREMVGKMLNSINILGEKNVVNYL